MKKDIHHAKKHWTCRMAAILTVILALASLTGCGGGKNETKATDQTSGQTADTGSSQDSTTDSTTGNVDNGELYEIVMEIPTLGMTPAGITDVEAAVNEQVQHLGVKVTLYPISVYDLATQTDLMIMNGDKLDLVITFVTGVGNLVNKGELLELDDLYAQYGSDIKNAEDTAMAGGYYNGTLYAIPSEEKHARSYGFFARKDILDELDMSFDVDKIYSLEDLEELFAAYKAEYGDGHYCIAGTNAKMDFYDQMYAIDNLGCSNSTGVLLGAGLDGETKIENLYASDEYKEYAGRMYQWAQAGYFSPDAATNTDSGTVQVQSGYYLGKFNDTETDMTSNLSRDCGYEMVPITLAESYATTSMYQVSMWGIPSTCENPEKTFQFLNYLYADNDVANILTNGLEGVTYDVVEKGERPGQMVIQYADGVNAANAPYIMPLHVFGDKLNIGVFEPMTLDYYTMAKEFNESIPDSRKSLSLGYVFDSTSVSTQRSAVDAVVQQYVGMIACGTQDPTTLLKEFNEALSTAGIDDIMTENQTQFDAWLEQK